MGVAILLSPIVAAIFAFTLASAAYFCAGLAKHRSNVRRMIRMGMASQLHT